MKTHYKKEIRCQEWVEKKTSKAAGQQKINRSNIDIFESDQSK